MLPKERIIAALEHREADRVPIGELAADFEITERVLGHPTYYRSKWREYVAEWDGRRDEIAESYWRDISDLTLKLEWDYVGVPPVPARRSHYQRPEMLGEYKWRDESGKVWQYSPASGGHAMLVYAPPMDLDDIVVPEHYAVDPSQLEAIAGVVKEIGKTHFVIGRTPGGTFPWFMTVGLDEFLMRMVTQPEFVEKASEAYCRQDIAWAEAICDLGVDAISEGVDYCDNRGPMMGLPRFRKFILPYLERIVKAVHAKGKYFIKHSDGNNWAILDDMVEIGIDGWQGIQPQIGMDPKALKQRYGGRLCLFGGVDNRSLIAGSADDVVREVEYAIRHAGPGGGLVLTSSNTLQPGVKYENYMAMLKATRELGTYPLSV